MRITFDLKGKQDVAILGDGKVIGQIFSPSGTSRDCPNSIQVCGFKSAFDLWGCGVFCDNEGNPRKDIQLLFDKETKVEGGKWFRDLPMNELCHKCFFPKKDCRCKDLIVKTMPHLTLDSLMKEVKTKKIK